VLANPFRVSRRYRNVFAPGLPKLNPGLELANTFGVSDSVVKSLAFVSATETPRTQRSHKESAIGEND